MKIEQMTSNDLAPVRQRASQLAAEMYPELIEDIGKMHALGREILSSTRGYARVVRCGDTPVAALMARVGDSAWATRKLAGIVLWYSDAPGAGLALLCDFKRWVCDRGDVAVAGFTVDWDGPKEDQRKIASAVGFKQRGGAQYYFPLWRKAA